MFVSQTAARLALLYAHFSHTQPTPHPTTLICIITASRTPTARGLFALLFPSAEGISLHFGADAFTSVKGRAVNTVLIFRFGGARGERPERRRVIIVRYYYYAASRGVIVASYPGKLTGKSTRTERMRRARPLLVVINRSPSRGPRNKNSLDF